MSCERPSTPPPPPKDVPRFYYSRQSLLDLRDTEFSRRKPDILSRAWSRIGINSEGDPNDGIGRNYRMSDYPRGKNGDLSASSSTSSLANTSSSYMQSVFPSKRRTNLNEIKRMK